MAVSATSYRLPGDLKERLARRAAVEGVPESSLVTRLLEQGLATVEHPGIVFRAGPSGWRAGLAGGPDVDEVIRTIRTIRSSGVTGDAAVSEAADNLGIDERLVRVAVDYAAEHLDEIEQRLAENELAVERVRALSAARASVLNG